MLKGLLKGLLGRLAGYIGLALGFWLLYQALYQALRQANLVYGIPLGLLGGGSILLGMYFLVTARHIGGDSPGLDLPGSDLPGSDLDEEKEGTAGDSLIGSSQSDKLPP